MIRRERARRGNIEWVIAVRRLRSGGLRPVEAEASLVRLGSDLERAAPYIAALLNASTVAVVGIPRHSRLFEVRTVVRHPGIAVRGGHSRHKVRDGRVDLTLRGSNYRLS